MTSRMGQHDSVARRTLGNRYQLTSRIASGGMGEVWVARDQLLDRAVAVKLLRPDLVLTRGFLERFRSEARHAGKLSHPGIAHVYDYGEDELDDDKLAYLVMELVPGDTLSHALEVNGPLDLPTTLDLLVRAADALAAAHDAGIVHRDVKPANLLVTPSGDLKITDFGIARALESVHITDAGHMIGTAQYMSPEQATGAEVGPASDVYSLGVVGYELLSGHPPFAGAAAAVAMAQVRTAPPALPTAIPTDVRDLIMRAMSKQPDGRPADGSAFRDELRILQQRVLQPDLSSVDEEVAATLVDQSVAVATTPERSSNHDGSTALMSAPPRIARQLSADRVRRRGRAWACAIGAGALVVLAALAMAARSDEPFTPPAQATTVAPPATVSIDPEAYVGSPAADARTALEAAGLSVEITRIASELPAGSVARVEPIGPLKPGDTVVLSASLGPTPAADTATTQVRPGQGHGKDKK